jgi:hypothetical protein
MRTVTAHLSDDFNSLGGTQLTEFEGLSNFSLLSLSPLSATFPTAPGCLLRKFGPEFAPLFPAEFFWHRGRRFLVEVSN